jgi:hypothetical protein
MRSRFQIDQRSVGEISMSRAIVGVIIAGSYRQGVLGNSSWGCAILAGRVIRARTLPRSVTLFATTRSATPILTGGIAHRASAIA